MKRKLGLTILIIVILSFIVIIFTSCKKNNNNKDINIVATTYPISYLTKKMIGDDIKINQLVVGDFHQYKPSTQDRILIEDASLLLYFSKENEDGIALITLLQDNDIKNKSREVANNLNEIKYEHEGKRLLDPHFWTSPKQAIKMIDNIYNAIKEKLYNNFSQNLKNNIDNNYKTLKDKFVNLDKKYKDTLLNSKKKDLFVTHAAFGYLARDYFLNQHALTLEHSHEVSLNNQVKILEEIKNKKAKLLLYTSNQDKHVAEHVLETLRKQNYNDINIKRINLAISEHISNSEHSYFEMLLNNLEVLNKALN